MKKDNSCILVRISLAHSVEKCDLLKREYILVGYIRRIPLALLLDYQIPTQTYCCLPGIFFSRSTFFMQNAKLNAFTTSSIAEEIHLALYLFSS